MNRVILIGNVGKTPEVRTIKGDISVTKFSLATTEHRVDETTGESKDTTEWHSITAWGGTADYVGNYVKAGTKLCVEGKLHTEEWTDNDGKKRYATTIIAERLENLSPKPKEVNQEAETAQEMDNIDEDDLPF